MVLQLGQNNTVLVRFLKFLLSKRPKTNTDPYSTPQDSTLDTPQGGVLDNFFYRLNCEGFDFLNLFLQMFNEI